MSALPERSRLTVGLCVAIFLLVGQVVSPVSAKTSPPTARATHPAATQPAATRPGSKISSVAAATQPAEAGVVGWLELSGPLPDGPPSFAWLAAAQTKPSLRRIIAQLHFVANDAESRGVVIYLDQPELELSQIQEIAAGIAAVRAKGKKVAVFSEAYDLRTYLLACSADLILLQNKGMLELHGIGMEEIYLAGLLEKVGVKADLLQVGKFKGADEMFTRTGPSPEWSQNADALLDDLYEQILTRIQTARKLDRNAVLTAFADCWGMTDRDYVKRRLVDRLVDRDLTDATTDEFGAEIEWDEDMGQAPVLQQVDNPFALFRMMFQESKPRVTRPSLALINASGPITSGDSQTSGGNPGGMSGGNAGLFGGDSIGSRSLVEALSQAKDDEKIKGVVIRLDSPGGSALASEVIWQAVRELAEVKPVYVSVGPMAASGGYYIACAAHEIYVTPTSIVGSIGVVGGKMALGGLFAKIGVTVNRRTRGPLGDMFNSVEPFSPQERAAVLSSMQTTYETFLDRVRKGRGKRIEKLDDVAQGRLFTGAIAVKNGLADKIGGVDVALADLAKQVELKPGQYDVIDLPGPMSLPEYLQSIFGVQSPGALGGLTASSQDAATLAVARAVMGPRVWRHAQAALEGIMLLRRERALLLMPVAIDVK